MTIPTKGMAVKRIVMNIRCRDASCGRYQLIVVSQEREALRQVCFFFVVPDLTENVLSQVLRFWKCVKSM